MKDNNKIVLVVVGLLCVGCVLACIACLCATTAGVLINRTVMAYDRGGSAEDEWGSIEAGDEAPDFELPTLTGEEVRLSRLRGGPVLLSFSASWCPPCRMEVPTLQELHESYPQLTVLMVDIGESYWEVQDFAEEFDLTYTIALDEAEDVAVQYGLYAIPALFFIDSSGIVQVASVGLLSEEEMEYNLSKIGIGR